MLAISRARRGRFHVELIPRHPPHVTSKVAPTINDQSHTKYESTQPNDTFQRDSSPQSSSRNEITTKTTRISTINNTTETILIPTPNQFSTPVEKSNIVNNEKQTTSPLSRWFKRLTSRQKLFTKIVFVAILLTVCATVAILPPVFILVLRQSNSFSSDTNMTVSACSSQTCIGQETPFLSPGLTLLYQFDGSATDLSGYASGTPSGTNPPSTYYNQGYVRQTLVLNANLSQYVSIPSINLAQQSFTLQVWIYVLNTNAQLNYGIFGLCDSSSTCLSLSVLNYHITFSLNSMNINNTILMGASVLDTADWYHITVVYDSVLFQQLIYVNGLIDAVSNGIVYPYQGKSSGTTANIGLTSSFTYNSSYFNGWVDQFAIFAGVVRTSCEAYNDATLTAYYPFDTNGTFLDYSINYFEGVGSNIQSVTFGRLRQAIAFVSSTSYFQAQCFPTTRVNNPPFSVSLWIKPTIVVGGGTIIHVSGAQTGNGTICYDLLGLTNTGILVAQLMQTSTLVSGVQGPLLSINTWIHVALVYGSKSGMGLFINGQLYATSVMTTSPLPVVSYAIAQFITLGNISPFSSAWTVGCPSSSLPLVSGSYLGAIDEFRLYSRELTAQEICVLANV